MQEEQMNTLKEVHLSDEQLSLILEALLKNETTNEALRVRQGESMIKLAQTIERKLNGN